jgi:hypothetical protein
MHFLSLSSIYKMYKVCTVYTISSRGGTAFTYSRTRPQLDALGKEEEAIDDVKHDRHHQHDHEF